MHDTPNKDIEVSWDFDIQNLIEDKQTLKLLLKHFSSSE